MLALKNRNKNGSKYVNQITRKEIGNSEIETHFAQNSWKNLMVE